MNDSYAAIVVDDVDDTCSCGSVYHSIIDTPVEKAMPSVTAPALSPGSPVPTTFSVPELDSQSLKDQRSHERARQQLKKPSDHHKVKRCVGCIMCRPEKRGGNAGRPKQDSRVLRASLTEAEGERRAGLGDSVEWAEDGHGAALPPVARTVTLADLIKPPRKGSEKQFEMVGRPRQVLVLDEFTEVVEAKYELDDWEHIDFEAKIRKPMHKSSKAPSYARVVASRA